MANFHKTMTNALWGGFIPMAILGAVATWWRTRVRAGWRGKRGKRLHGCMAGMFCTCVVR